MNNTTQYRSLPDRIGCLVMFIIMIVFCCLICWGIYEVLKWVILFLWFEKLWFSVSILLLVAIFAFASVFMNITKKREERS